MEASLSLEHAPERQQKSSTRHFSAWDGYAKIPDACRVSAIGRSTLYKLAARYSGLFLKWGTATIVDMARLKSILPPEVCLMRYCGDRRVRPFRRAAEQPWLAEIKCNSTN
jgi:hypothetical protein